MSIQTRSMERISAEEKQQTWHQYRIFIEEMNSLISLALVEEFRNDNENISIQIQLLEMKKAYREKFKRIRISEVRLRYCNFHQNYRRAEYSYKLLKHGQYQLTKIFILISNPMTWSTTHLKDRKMMELLCDNQWEEMKDQSFLKKYDKFTENYLPLRKIHLKIKAFRDINNGF